MKGLSYMRAGNDVYLSIREESKPTQPVGMLYVTSADQIFFEKRGTLDVRLMCDEAARVLNPGETVQIPEDGSLEMRAYGKAFSIYFPSGLEVRTTAKK